MSKMPEGLPKDIESQWNWIGERLKAGDDIVPISPREIMTLLEHIARLQRYGQVEYRLEQLLRKERDAAEAKVTEQEKQLEAQRLKIVDLERACRLQEENAQTMEMNLQRRDTDIEALKVAVAGHKLYIQSVQSGAESLKLEADTQAKLLARVPKLLYHHEIASSTCPSCVLAREIQQLQAKTAEAEETS